MPLDKYCFNITSRQWVKSFDDPSTAPTPVWGYGDNRDFGVTFIRNLTSTTVEVVQGTSSVQVGLTTTTGTVLTSATSSGAVNNEYPFVLPISGAAVDSYMSGKTADTALQCEFLVTTSAGQNRYRSTVFISPRAITGATPDPTATEPALTQTMANGIFIAKEIPPGTTILWPDAITGERCVITLENRQFVARPLDA